MKQIDELKGNAGQSSPLHPATDVGTVTLKVADLRRSQAFYSEIIGLGAILMGEGTILLGAGNRPILKLVEVPGAQSQRPGTTGLYHAAILLPDRHALAIKAMQLAATGYPLGQSDHLVSEALYLSDPDGNGLELYRDRPRREWRWERGEVRMALDPIDFNSLFAEVKEGDAALANSALPEGTRLGHMHLRVGDLAAAERFYHVLLGFDVTARMPGALFLSAGGYHHHIGLNTWQSRGGKPPAEPSAGLREFSLAVPDQAEVDRLTALIEAAGMATEVTEDRSVVVLDPFQNRIRLNVGEASNVAPVG